MIHDFISEWETYIRKYRRNKRRNQIMAMLIVLVVFCTTYALMVPAITMERTVRFRNIHIPMPATTRLQPPQ